MLCTWKLMSKLCYGESFARVYPNLCSIRRSFIFKIIQARPIARKFPYFRRAIFVSGQMSAQSKLRRCCEKTSAKSGKTTCGVDNICGFVAVATWACKEYLFPSHICRRKMKTKNSIHTGFSTMSRRGGTRHSRHDLNII